MRIRGVPIRVDLSWVLIAGFVVWRFAEQLSEVLADFSTPVLFASAAVGGLLFFASLLAHELGHAFTSLDRGIRVRGILLFLLGGVTESEGEAKTARDEFVIVGIGPFISLVLAATFGLLSSATFGVQPYAAVLGYLGWFNLLLAVFNILPGYPLDGGRLLRSVLWMATGRRHAATRWAARVGQVFALALLLGGVYGALGGRLPAGVPFRLLLSFLVGGGLWGAFIGYFLLRGASQAHRRAVLSEGLASQTARDLMGNVPPALPSDASLDEVLARLQERPSLLWPVGDPVQGGVRLADLDTVVREEWPRVRLGEIAHDGPGVTVAADTALDEVLERMAGAPGNMLIVTDQGAPVGLLTPSLVGAVR